MQATSNASNEGTASRFSSSSSLKNQSCQMASMPAQGKRRERPCGSQVDQERLAILILKEEKLSRGAATIAMKTRSVGFRTALVAAALFLGYLEPHSHAFQAAPLRKILRCHGESLVRREANNDVSPDASVDNDGNDDESSEKVVGHAGGRRRLPRRRGPKKISERAIIPAVVALLAPAIVLSSLLLIVVPVCDYVSSPSYYYQSTSLESRVYSQDGGVQISRKESFETNIPSLLEGRRLVEDKRLLEDKRFMEEGYSRPSIEHDDF